MMFLKVVPRHQGQHGAKIKCLFHTISLHSPYYCPTCHECVKCLDKLDYISFLIQILSQEQTKPFLCKVHSNKQCQGCKLCCWIIFLHLRRQFWCSLYGYYAWMNSTTNLFWHICASHDYTFFVRSLVQQK